MRSTRLNLRRTESGVDAQVIEEIAKLVATAGTRFQVTTGAVWLQASAAAGPWRVALFMLNALLGAIATEGGVYPNAWNKFVPRPIYTPPHPKMWNETTWPREYPLSMNEMSFLLPHFLKDGRAKLDVYFTRVYNPVWTNPDGFSWIEMLTDPDLVGCYVALTPTWNETSYYADYVLPMGVGSERHDLHSYETHDSQWLGFRQPVMKAAAPTQWRNDRRHAPGQSGRGVGGERILARVDVAHRSGWKSWDSAVCRIEKEPRHSTRHRRVLRMDLRQLGSRSAGTGRRREFDAARIHASLRRV